MALDEFGFPKPEHFNQVRGAGGPRVTLRRAAILMLAIVVAVVGALGVHFWPQVQEKMQASIKAAKDGQVVKAYRQCVFSLQQGKLDLALTECNRLISFEPANLGYVELRAVIYARMKRYRSAIDDCDRILQAHPNDAQALNNRAYFRALLQVDLVEAFRDVEKAIAKSGELSAYVDTRGYLHYLFGRFPRALKDFNSILDNPDFADNNSEKDLERGETYFHRGLVYKQMGEVGKAERDYQEARRRGYRITEEPQPAPRREAAKET